MPAAIAGAATGIISFAGLTDQTLTDTPSYITLDSDRSFYSSSDTTGATKWIVHGAPSNYEAQVTMDSGTLSSGTVGSWVALSSDQTWQKNGGSCVFTLEVRDKYTLAVVKTVSMDFSA
jgi:hypothetical protein